MFLPKNEHLPAQNVEQKNPKFQKKVIITHKGFEKNPTFKKNADYRRGFWNTPDFENWSWIFVHLKMFLKFFAQISWIPYL